MNDKPTWDDIRKAQKVLEDNHIKGPYVIKVHPIVWNGRWEFRHRSHLLRWIGRKLHSPRIYWLGINVHWCRGLKEDWVDE
jgi:hypothetical protein